jgi:hypothetical protein
MSPLILLSGGTLLIHRTIPSLTPYRLPVPGPLVGKWELLVDWPKERSGRKFLNLRLNVFYTDKAPNTDLGGSVISRYR